MTRATEIDDYHRRLAPEDRAICEVLAAEIERVLPDAEGRVWHAHPVWFLDGNPIVGYHRLKDAVRLMFWSGQSFAADGLAASGTFQAAEARFLDAAEVDIALLADWLAESRRIQWDYEHIRTNRGLVKRTEF
ncbi:DUF1801 domain-containing protein [Microbacterium sp. C5A9]|uniref:DUF1801 domain-containing protein n=1 Tax=Microbacterium sp. C5A9 TaxID=2736663 RepID=UPI001F5223C6|nr:DUF1801 domain-containing protein [Microbacterium sp. C5A9]MCI1017269.1 DUF1801 domain-containing protein [Microbacterium sp. C5A9]